MEQEKIEAKIKEIEKEIESLPYHKGTEHHIGKLKAQLAKLRLQIIEKRTKKKGQKSGFAVKKEGNATVVLVGFPSVGKSTLLNKLTCAKSKVADYPFTTLTVIPGMLYFKGAKIQVLDVPGLIQGAAMGKGRGKEVLSVVRIADLLLLVSQATNPNNFSEIEKELYSAGVRLDTKKPEIIIEHRTKGGLEITGHLKSMSQKTAKALISEFGIINAKISLKEDITQEQLIDSLLKNRVYVPTIKILSKIDLVSEKEKKKLLEKFGNDCILISAQKNINIEKLKKRIFEKLELIRIYLRESQDSELKKEPLICKKGITVLEAAKKISEELAQEIKKAKIKGTSADHPNQLVGLTHKLEDNDEVLFIK